MTSLLDWIEVYSAQDCIEANMLKGLLELDSIKVQLKGEALGGALGEIPFDQIQVKICVPQIKQRQAEKILLEYQSKHLVVCDWKCQNCNEYNGCGFEICWSCLKPK